LPVQALLPVGFEFCEDFFNPHADEAVEYKLTMRARGPPGAPAAWT
jgi:hypothetical protein